MNEFYEGQQFVGMDLHRRRSVLVRMTETGEHLETVRIVNTRDRLAEVMTRARVAGGGVGGHVRADRAVDALAELGASACSSAGRSTGSIRIAQTRSGAGLSRPRGPGMSSPRRLCGTANAGSGGADPVAIKPIGSAALEPARTSP